MRADDWLLESEEPAFGPGSLVFVLAGLLLAVVGLWIWREGGSWSWTQGAQRPEIMGMAIRCAAVGLIAAGEAVWMGLVINRIYPADGFSRLLQWIALGAMLIALVSAAALAWAGR